MNLTINPVDGGDNLHPPPLTYKALLDRLWDIQENLAFATDFLEGDHSTTCEGVLGPLYRSLVQAIDNLSSVQRDIEREARVREDMLEGGWQQ